MSDLAAQARVNGVEGLAHAVKSFAESRGGAIAVIDGSHRWSYAELAEAAGAIQSRLSAAGVRAGDVVGIAGSRSRHLVASIVAVLGLGATYVPLDPAYPTARLAGMIHDGGVRFVCLEREHEWLPGDIVRIPMTASSDLALKRSSLVAAERSDNIPAYIIFTSGSTGQPKGVAVPESAVLALLDSADDVYRFGAGDVWTLFCSHCFDVSVWEIWGSLCHGGTLVVVSASTTRDPQAFLDLLAAEQVTVLNQVPSAFKHLASAQLRRPRDLALRYVIFAGEALDKYSARLWLKQAGSSAKLVNMYGITETTVHVTYAHVTEESVADDTSPTNIGRPLSHLDVQLVDEAGHAVPHGAPGELLVAGRGLAIGYVGLPQLTEERFPTLTFDGRPRRWYRSGDLCRATPDGTLEFLGRLDDQVQVRGFRIELGEIETTLRQIPEVEDAAVGVDSAGVGEKILVAYVVLRPGAEERAADRRMLQAACTRSLPSHMIPGHFVFVSSLPTTPSGKLDRKALRGHASLSAESPLPVNTASTPSMLFHRPISLGRTRRQMPGLSPRHLTPGGGVFAFQSDHGSQIKYRVGSKDFLVQILQLPVRVGAIFVGQHGAQPGVGFECIGLPPAPVKRKHQQRQQSFVERFHVHPRPKLADQLLVLAHCEPRLKQRLDRDLTLR
jgi:amino acid adenylation domain-containing protein